MTFSSIPQGYTDLVLVSQLTGSAANNQINIQVGNGSVDTGSNYSFTQLYGTGSAAASARSTSQTSILLGYTDAATTSIDSNLIASIQNYSNTTTNKTILSRGNSPARATAAIVGLWRSTSAINIITVSTGSSTFAVGSTFTIYGIAATSVGAKATGGTIFSDSQYYYHAFTGNGTFTPTQSISADVLVVAGGGGGGSNRGGGGGAGGLRYFANQSLTAINYSITVGAGGAGAPAGGGAGTGAGTVGVNSSFASNSASGGGYGAGNYVAGPANGGPGGSGGGGGLVSSGTSTGGSGNAGAYSPVEGFAGGGGSAGSGFAGGGGGSGAIGVAATTSAAGAGGTGINTYSNFASATGTGASGFYAGGGGGGSADATAGGAGGAGGGGAGGNVTINPGINAIANTGSGGGGSHAAVVAGAGGSGIVIVRYLKA